MEPIKPNHLWGANFEARTVKDIIELIFNKVSVKAALDETQARATDSSPEQRITELSIDAVADRLVAWLDKWVFTPLLGVGGRAVD
jgi:hypothetical protein